MEAVEDVQADLSQWVPGARLFALGDDQWMVIDADTTEYPDGPTVFIRRDTCCFYCGPGGVVTDLVPDHTFPPGTTAEEALAALGHR